MGKKFKPLFYVHILNKILYKAMKDLVPDFFFNYSSLVLYTTQAKESRAFHAPWRAPHNQRALIPHSAETSLTGHSSTLVPVCSFPFLTMCSVINVVFLFIPRGQNCACGFLHVSLV